MLGLHRRSANHESDLSDAIRESGGNLGISISPASIQVYQFVFLYLFNPSFSISSLESFTLLLLFTC
ncbi:unnamed protein product [Cuscuta campestris]|uniref:Uncharacterized protein n=1 Tax=Cuscuta campestris TaxID=132261 RepID=A0A484N1J4_9ASTE|nr:unnamed protein product [Cuscuta campestris]